MWRNVRIIVAVLIAMSCAPLPAFADGLSQVSVPNNVEIDCKPPGDRCAGPLPSPLPKHVFRDCSPHGVPYSINIVSNADVTRYWSASVEVVPPTPGVTVELGCDPAAVLTRAQEKMTPVQQWKKNWCQKLGDGPALFALAPGARLPRYSITIKVASSGAPVGKQVLIKFCLAREGIDPICTLRKFTTAGGTTHAS